MQQLFQSAPHPTRRLLLYLNGWALGPVAVAHLGQPKDRDLLILWDYREDALTFDFSPYEEIQIVAWSMGIWATDRLLERLPSLRDRITTATALGGTGYPMDDRYGIPETIYLATLESITEANRPRFNRQMVGGKTYRHLHADLSARSTEAIREELLRPYALTHASLRPVPKPAAQGVWTKAYIGTDDRVVPPASQRIYWKEQGVATEEIKDGVHYLLGYFSSWEELL